MFFVVTVITIRGNKYNHINEDPTFWLNGLRHGDSSNHGV